MKGHGGQVMLALCQYLQLGILCNTRDNRSHTVKNEIAQAPSVCHVDARCQLDEYAQKEARFANW